MSSVPPPRRFYLVGQDGGAKELAWCWARGRKGAMTVFRGIPALTPRGTQLSVGPVVRDDLSPGATYWVREGGRSVPYAFPWTELDATTMQPLTQEQLHPAR